jgi:prevent-host-death family protein
LTTGPNTTIEETVSAAEANRGCFPLLHGVRDGRSYVVTAHGRPIARLEPISEAASAEDQVREAAKRELVLRLENQPVIDIRRWTRDELYDRLDFAADPVARTLEWLATRPRDHTL